MAAMAIRGLASLSLSCAPPAPSPLRIEAREPTRKETVKVRLRRIRKKLNGTEERPPLAVFRSNKHLYAQVIDDTKQHTLASSSTLKKAMREEIEMSSGPTVSARRLITRTAASRQQYNVPQQPETLPLWLWICISSYQTLKDALSFLWEQPGQLQFIEWPSLQSTIRMAMLTVVVVAFLIIFLATVDSTFSFVLSSILRRVP